MSKVKEREPGTEDVVIRVAVPEDAEMLLRIYAPYVENTAISFEYTVPDAAEFRARIEKTLKRYPYLAAEIGGEIVGYAYAGPFHARQAYEHCSETSIYVREDQRGNGVGRLLYDALARISKAQNVTNLYACIACPSTEDEFLTRCSVHFHTHMGYAMIGEFPKCGFKFGRWYGIVWMGKMIGTHAQTPLPLIPFPALGAEKLDALGIAHGVSE